MGWGRFSKESVGENERWGEESDAPDEKNLTDSTKETKKLAEELRDPNGTTFQGKKSLGHQQRNAKRLDTPWKKGSNPPANAEGGGPNRTNVSSRFSAAKRSEGGGPCPRGIG